MDSGDSFLSRFVFLGRSEFEIFVNETTSVNNQSNTIDLRFYEPEVFVSEENSYRIGNLLPGVEYIIRIKTYGQQGQSSNEYRNVTVITRKFMKVSF